MAEFANHSQRITTDGGNEMIAAELLWGALAQGLIAAPDVNGCSCDGHQGYKKDTRQLPGNSERRRQNRDGRHTSQPENNSTGIFTEDF